jgi:23S rRNA pseudoU1915 N3-methylase RlmH
MLLDEKLQKEHAYKIVLSPTGKNISTEQFRDVIETQKNAGKKIVISIG